MIDFEFRFGDWNSAPGVSGTGDIRRGANVQPAPSIRAGSRILSRTQFFWSARGSDELGLPNPAGEIGAAFDLEAIEEHIHALIRLVPGAKDFLVAADKLGLASTNSTW